jgi:hypothetical protein
MTKSECGALGGTATYNRYGRDEMSRRGKLGGRPRNKTLSEIRRQQALDAEYKLKEVFKGRGNHRRANKERGCRCVSR